MNVFQRIQQRIALCGGLGAIALQHWGTVMFFIFVFVVLVCAASALFFFRIALRVPPPGYHEKETEPLNAVLLNKRVLTRVVEGRASQAARLEQARTRRPHLTDPSLR